jgi:UDP-2-acetamido-3-amino-2,3-dideoxy-glucuronate N-acetyltransferase
MSIKLSGCLNEHISDAILAVMTPTVCVVGGGHWGKNLVRNFHQIGHLAGICDMDAKRAEALAAQHSGVRVYPTFEGVLADPALDAIALATPAEHHAAMTIAGLNAGKHVFVEKPLALTAEDGRAMVDAGRQNRKILMVGHLLIHHPAIRKVHELLHTGQLGKLEYIYSNRLSMGKIRQEENALWSFAPHDISVILLLTGQLPLEVTAVGGTYLQPNIADVTVSNLLFDRGVRAHIFVSWLHPYKEQRLVVVGSKKMVVFEETRPGDKLVIYDKEIAWKNGQFEVTQPKGMPVPYAADEPLRAECQHFVECLKAERRPATSGEVGVRVLEVLEACQRSLSLNGQPVRCAPARAFA